MLKFINNKKGFIALILAILILGVVLAIILSVSFLAVGEQKIINNFVVSDQSYYTAEAGIEDALLRLKNNPSMPALSYSFPVGSGATNVVIPIMIGGSRVLTSQGSVSGRIRKAQAVYAIDADSISFHYGAQIGDGGMEMGNNSRIKGNVFSNGSVIAGSGRGYIDNSIIVAHNGNKIKGLSVGQDATVHTCENSTITGTLTYVSGGSVINCSAGVETKSRPNEIPPEDLPISQSQINDWKADGLAGGVITNDYIIDGTTASLGPVQIGTDANPRNLTITNNARIRVTGTIYVTGNITFSNNATIELDSASYGSFSGVIIADGKINVSNNVVLKGSGVTGSYLLIFSTNNSLDPASPAILVSNNAEGAIFYANQGMILLNNNMEAREITGYKIKIENNAEIEYESGLENTLFSSGPGGSWQVEDWKETE